MISPDTRQALLFLLNKARRDGNATMNRKEDTDNYQLNYWLGYERALKDLAELLDIPTEGKQNETANQSS